MAKPEAVAMHVFGAGFMIGAEDHVKTVVDLETFPGFERTVTHNRPRLNYKVDPEGAWNLSEYAGAEIFYGNPRCSAFSPINIGHGKSGSHGHEGKQTVDLRQFWEATKKLKPRYAVFESVQQAGSVGRPLLDQIYDDLKPLGYRFAEVYFDNQHHGVPQRRKRFFGIFYRSGEKFNIDKIDQKSANVFETIKDLEPIQAYEMKSPFVLDESVQGHLADGTPIRNHGYMPVDGRIYPHMIIKNVEKGKSICHLDDEVLKHSPRLMEKRQAGKTFGWAPILRLRDDGLSNVIYSRSYSYIHPHLHRPITIREAARLMGFPDDWTLLSRDGFVQVGNGVAVPCGSWIIGEVIRNMTEKTKLDQVVEWDSKKRASVVKDSTGALVKKFKLNNWTPWWENGDAETA